MSDSGSVCSSHSATSVSLSKMTCPYCVKDLQVRQMFAHIRKFHSNEILKNTNRKWLQDAEQGKPLRVWWTTMNDFDEEESTIIYVCLSTNKTFTTEVGCEQHFKKDKKVLKDHNIQLKQLKKDYEAMKKEKAKKAKQTVKPKTAFDLARDQNSPELARAIWKGLLHHKRVCEVAMSICQRRGYTNQTVMYFYDTKTHTSNPVTYDVFNEKYEKLMTTIQSLKEQQCLDVKPLLDVWSDTWNFWSHNFRESLFEFSESMRDVFPSYNQFIGNDDLFGFATDEMEGVDF